MLDPENTAALKAWADGVRESEARLKADVEGRDAAIRELLSDPDYNVGATELMRITGLTRARIYQIRDDPRYR
jgi:hypothetical protein